MKLDPIIFLKKEKKNHEFKDFVREKRISLWSECVFLWVERMLKRVIDPLTLETSV